MAINVKPLHPTFGAEVEGLDLTKPLSPEVFEELLGICRKYGVVGIRKTGLDHQGHINFAKQFGELDDITPYIAAGRKLRVPHIELFDVSNIDGVTGDIVGPDSPKFHQGMGNFLFHVDSSFNARRAGFSILRACELPPEEYGGDTEFADSRTAYQDLTPELKERIKDLVADHSQFHSRKLADPEYYKDLDPTKSKMGRHKIAQLHEGSQRMNLYVAAHMHHIEGLPKEESDQLIKTLLDHATQPKYQLAWKWKNVGDIVIWDNTAVLHRSFVLRFKSARGAFEGKFRRDMLRATVHDSSSLAYGLNGEGETWRIGMP